ncbi:hypothetical protein KYJ26_03280 [Bacillus sp. MCCB 382]|uniref:hypothetical protein n=1 Tax=Bacillus sp. MCCB 382 TaxID=2860197 RepID=UPI001C59E387|nr:hypothetical protein [Bacillus sp. MCCB 382]
MKTYKELSYTQRAKRLIIPTCLLASFIIIPRYPIWIYVMVMSFMVGSIGYNLKKHRESKKDTGL